VKPFGDLIEGDVVVVDMPVRLEVVGRDEATGAVRFRPLDDPAGAEVSLSRETLERVSENRNSERLLDDLIARLGGPPEVVEVDPETMAAMFPVDEASLDESLAVESSEDRACAEAGLLSASSGYLCSWCSTPGSPFTMDAAPPYDEEPWAFVLYDGEAVFLLDGSSVVREEIGYLSPGDSAFDPDPPEVGVFYWEGRRHWSPGPMSIRTTATSASSGRGSRRRCGTRRGRRDRPMMCAMRRRSDMSTNADAKPVVEVTGTCEGVELDKRTYLPGVTVKSTCPRCGVPWSRDMGSHYLSYPKVGEPVNVYGYCGSCEHEWPVMVVVRLVLEPAS
jgi:hypothetical protein